MRTAAVISGSALVAVLAWAELAAADSVSFPEDYKEGVHYATVKRGNITEELFTSRTAIAAAKSGQPLPSGTVITMENDRDGNLFRYVVMEMRTSWGGDYPPGKRNGEWEFQAFNSDKTVKRNENLDRCFACRSGGAGLRVHAGAHEARSMTSKRLISVRRNP